MRTRLQYTIGAITFAFSVALAACAVPLPGMTSTSVEAAVKNPKVSKKVTIKKGKKKTVKVKNIRRIVKVKSSKKKIVTVKKKGKKVILKAKKKTGKATVKITVKDLRGKKRTLKMKVTVKKSAKTTPKQTKKYVNKDGIPYVGKWEWAASDKMFIEDQHIGMKLLSRSLNDNNGMWKRDSVTTNDPVPNMDCNNTYTFEITNNQDRPIVVKNMAVDVGSGHSESDYYIHVLHLQKYLSVYYCPSIWDGFAILSGSDVTIPAHSSKVITWSQPEAVSIYNIHTDERWIRVMYKDGYGRKNALSWCPYYEDFACMEGWG